MTESGSLRTSVADDLGSLAEAFAGSPPPRLSAGTVVGEHFELEALLGRGGMGEVHRALDRRLGRRVALKLVRPGADVARLRREATTLAQLAHPNVVTIYEVGEHAGAPFVAMELCDQGTIGQWQRAAPRPWREVLARYVAAGRGLAAAHAAGLIHRDIKPDNILLDRDGRPRIADFGLARAAGPGGGPGATPLDPRDAITVDGAATPAPAPDDAPAGEAGTRSDAVTASGVIVGTPYYMAPEQLDGGDLDARTDQFGFAVALYEALAGVPPFTAARHARAFAIATGRLTAPRTDVPRRVLAPLARALAARPDARWPDLPALLAALERAARRRWWLAAAPLAAAAAAVAWWAWPQPSGPAGCAPPAAEVRAALPPATRAALAARPPGGPALVTVLDHRLTAWRSLRQTTCHQATAGGPRTVAALASLACLDQRMREVAQAVDLAGDTTTDLARLAMGIEQLPPIDECADGARYAQAEPLPPEPALAGRVARDRMYLAEAGELGRRGRFDAALALLDQLPAAAEFPPLLAELAYTRASILVERGDAAGAETAYRQALTEAAASHHAEVQVQALLDLAFLLAADLDRLDERRRGEIDNMLALAEGVLRGLHPDDDLARHLHGNRAYIRMQLGDLPAALADAREAQRLAEAAPPGAHAEEVVTRTTLASVLLRLDRYDEAAAVIAPAIAAIDARWPDRTSVARSALETAAAIAAKRRDFDRASALADRASAALAAVYGRDGEPVRQFRVTIGALLLAEGDAAGAATAFRAVLAPAPGGAAPPPLAVATAQANLAIALTGLDRLAEARAAADQAVATFTATLGPDHPMLIAALCTAALLALDTGDAATAERTARRAHALAAPLADSAPLQLANAAATLALVLATRGHDAAAPLARQARDATAGPDGNPAIHGEAVLALALLQARRGDAAGARAAAEAAVAELAPLGIEAIADVRRGRALLARLARR